MKWKDPWDGWRGFLILWVIIGLSLFVMTWLGYGNGPMPKFWGSPLDVSQAVVRLPRVVGLAFVLTLAIGLTGFKTGD